MPRAVPFLLLQLAALLFLAGAGAHVPDDVWDEAARHYDEQGLATLVFSIAMINTWNRINVTTRQLAGQEW